MSSKLTVLSDVERRLAAVRTVDEAKSIRDQAEAIRVYAKSARKGLVVQNQAALVKIQAERRAGELLAVVERKQGKNGNGLRSTMERSGIAPVIGHRWQKMATVPESQLRRLAALCTEREQELSSAAVYGLANGKAMAVHYASESAEWGTPQALFDTLDAEFGFDLDVCASEANAKCRKFFTAKQDGLRKEWRGTCWMNPPYGDAIAEWVEKAFESGKMGATVVCLVPARVDTAWWWDFCRYGEIRFLHGRLRFGDSESGAPFPSAVVIFPCRKPTVLPEAWWSWQTA